MPLGIGQKETDFFLGEDSAHIEIGVGPATTEVVPSFVDVAPFVTLAALSDKQSVNYTA